MSLSKLKYFPELLKMRITIFVAFSATIGYIMYRPVFDADLLISNFGVFLLACGASALNHFQEKETDALMKRTKNRPIPGGYISPVEAFLTGITLILLGAAILLYFINLLSMILGITAFIWYNVIYTPMKRKNAMAVVPGAIIGAIPPVIGWVAAGGELTHPAIISIALFFFIWQIPHFWILVLLYNEDYKGAGFPTLFDNFNAVQIGRITYAWIAGLAVSSMMIPLFSVSNSLISAFLILFVSLWLIWKSYPILNNYFEKMILRKAFLNINLFVLIVTVIISLDKLIIN